jgi:hypothetical protein
MKHMTWYQSPDSGRGFHQAGAMHTCVSHAACNLEFCDKRVSAGHTKPTLHPWLRISTLKVTCVFLSVLSWVLWEVCLRS